MSRGLPMRQTDMPPARGRDSASAAGMGNSMKRQVPGGNRHIDADTGGMAGQLASSPTPNSIKSDNPIRGMKSS